MQYVYLEIL